MYEQAGECDQCGRPCWKMGSESMEIEVVFCPECKSLRTIDTRSGDTLNHQPMSIRLAMATRFNIEDQLLKREEVLV